MLQYQLTTKSDISSNEHRNLALKVRETVQRRDSTAEQNTFVLDIYYTETYSEN